MKLFLPLVMLGLALAGCRSGTLLDPNDPTEVAVRKPEVLRRNLKGASDMLNQRKMRGEIDDAEYDRLIKQYAEDLIRETELEQVPVDEAWLYAEVLITARQWQVVEPLLREAVKHAIETENTDRRVNDSLRLARVEAELGKVPEAIEIAKATFSAGVLDKAPILPAILYEVVPAGKGKEHDAELAQLLEKAIEQHEAVVVDPALEAGKAFLIARPHHVRKGWEEAARLYQAAGKSEDARRCALQSEQVGMSSGNL